MNLPLYAVYGASGCGRSLMPVARSMVPESLLRSGRLVFIDDASGIAHVNGHPVMPYSAFMGMPASERFVVIAIANSQIRERIASRLDEDGVKAWTITAANVVVMDDVVIGEGSALSPFVTLTSNIRIGRHFHANLYSYVEHDCVIGDFVTFAPGVKCNGNIIIEDHVYIGSGAVIKQGTPDHPLVIGKGAVVGMGAVVTRSVPPGVTVIGNPARPVTRN